MIAVSCTQWETDTRIVLEPRSADSAGLARAHVASARSQEARFLHVPSQAFRKHLIRGLSCLPSPSPSAARACMRAHRYTHAHKLVHLQRESHSGKQCTCAVYRLHTGSSAGDEMGGVCVCVCVGGSAVREQRRVLLPNTRTPSALYDNVRVQERQS